MREEVQTITKHVPFEGFTIAPAVTAKEEDFQCRTNLFEDQERMSHGKT
jgi:hypothetical protein